MRQSVDSDPNHNHNHENSKVKEESPRVFGISTSHLTASMTMNDVTNHNSIAINLDPSRISSSSIIDDSTISANLLARNTMVITDLKPQRKPAARNSEVGNGPVHYQGTTLNMAAGQGNLPLFVMLWGMSKAKKVNLLASDVEGNNPLHHAARAETTEVITFMFGQTKGFYTPEVRLVDTRNNLGETPLLKAATIGKISVVKAFLEEGSDPFVANDTGDTVFITLAKFGHLWAFHYLFIHIRDKYNEHTVLDHLHACDSDGHNCLDWAADSGTVNLIEYLIRRGMNPQRLDSCGRGPLFWAVKSHRTDAVRFLLRCGCDPHATDSSGISPYSTAKERRDSDLLYLIAKESKKNRLKQQQQQQTSAFKSSNYEAPPTTTEEANSADLATSDIEQPNMTSETNFTSKDLQMVQMNQIAGHTGQFLHSTSSHYLRQSQSSNGHLRQSQSSQGDIDLVATSLLPPSPPSAPTGNTPPQGRGKHHTPRGSFSTMSSTGVSPARLTFQLLKFTQSATMSFHNDPLASDPDGLELVSYAAPRSYLNFLCSSSVESKDKSGEIRHSHAIQQADSTRFLPCLYYLALYSGFWVLTMCIPFYFWLALLGITVALYRYISYLSFITLNTLLSNNIIFQ